ncbi:MAG: hypothetical protein ABIW79_00065 [Gemmatimonas sp.]
MNASVGNLTGVETMSVTGVGPESVVPERWEFWRDRAGLGDRNMATDAALLRRAARRGAGGPGVWRCYSWAHPTLSFGRNEATRGRFDDRSVARAGLRAVRRPTGGRALLHSREVTYSVAMPLAVDVVWRVAYDEINRLLLAALRSLGLPVDVVNTLPVEADRAGHPAIRPDGPLCFAAPALGEITAGGVKLVASSVWRERGAYLQHGSILLHDDQGLIVGAASNPVPVPPSAAALSSLVADGNRPDIAHGSPESDEAIRRTLVDAMERELAAKYIVTPFTAEASMNADITAFEEQFAGRDWLWRR